MLQVGKGMLEPWSAWVRSRWAQSHATNHPLSCRSAAPPGQGARVQPTRALKAGHSGDETRLGEPPHPFSVVGDADDGGEGR